MLSQRLATKTREQVAWEAETAIVALLWYGKKHGDELSAELIEFRNTLQFAIEVISKEEPHDLNLEALRRMVGAVKTPREMDRRHALAARLVAECGAELDRFVGDLRKNRIENLVACLAGMTDEKFWKLSSDLSWVGDELAAWTTKPQGKKGKRGTAAVLARLALRVGAFECTKARTEENVRKAIEKAIVREAKSDSAPSWVRQLLP